MAGFGGARGLGPYARGFRGTGRGGYDRGEYGSSYPSFGGYPGSPQRGMYYGGGQGAPRRMGGYDAGYGRGGAVGYGQSGGYGRGTGYGQDFGRGSPGFGGGRTRGYDAGFAREPFLPETAYQRHPELNRPQAHSPDRWPDKGHPSGQGEQPTDDEIRQAIRENLYQDTWVDADRIDVSVENGVVTLRGEIHDYLEARYAWDDAWEAAGVHGVINQLTVRTDLTSDEHGDVLPQTAGETTTG